MVWVGVLVGGMHAWMIVDTLNYNTSLVCREMGIGRERDVHLCNDVVCMYVCIWRDVHVCNDTQPPYIHIKIFHAVIIKRKQRRRGTQKIKLGIQTDICLMIIMMMIMAMGTGFIIY